MSDTLLRDALALYAGLFAGLLLASLLLRLFCGATLSELFRSRFYEVAPVRGVIHVVHVLLWGLAALLAFAALREGLAWHEGKPGAHGTQALFALLGAIVASGSALGWLYGLVFIRQNPPPIVSVEDVRFKLGIPRGRLTHLGRERFPNTLSDGWKAELWMRGGLVLLCLALFGLVGWCCTDGAAEWRQLGLRGMTEACEATRFSAPPLALLLGLSSGLTLVLLACTNRAYMLVTFPQVLVLQAILVAGLLWGLGSLLVTAETLVWVLVACAGLCMWRWSTDLSRGLAYRRMKLVYDAIAQRLRQAVPFLHELPTRDDCRLEDLDPTTISTRLTQGCRNVEEADLLVRRNFARFMQLAEVEHEQFAVAAMRYLTVGRYVSETGGVGTLRGFQNPTVPAWNETLFPLQPPGGYVDWLDPLTLGAEWDRVCTCPPCGGSGQVNCGGCGGSGQVTRTETYTEYSGGQTVTRTREYRETCGGCGGSGRVTCGSCGGSGRLEHKRILNTRWQKLVPMTTSPEVPMPELLEGAEEKVYYSVEMIEDRNWLPWAPRKALGLARTLFARLDEAAHEAAANLEADSAKVVELHEARYLYRAGFHVAGLWVLCIHFRKLRGKLGWFFGRRPEFYFPRLPFSLGMAGSVVLLPPLVILSLLWLYRTLQP